MDHGVHVILVGDEYRYAGILSTQGFRVQEVLNDPQIDYLELSDATMTRVGDADGPATRFSQAIVRKDVVNLTLIRSQEHEAPRQRTAYYIEKQRFRAVLTVPRYLVRGEIYTAPCPQPPPPAEFLALDVDDYFPMTNAQLHPAQGMTQRARVVIVRKGAVELFHLGQVSDEPRTTQDTA